MLIGSSAVGGGAEPKPLPASRNPLIDGKPWITAPLLAKRELHAKVSHGLQLQSLWRIPTAAVSYMRQQVMGYSCNPYRESLLQL